VEMERLVLNHGKFVGADGRGDIPPRWFVSVLWGLMSAGPGYMLK